MIDKPDEHRRMFAVEEQLWWYRQLHKQVIRRIQARFGQQQDLAIFDAGCGTGGLLHRLRQHGFTNLAGVDGSAEGVACCRERGLIVNQLDLNDLASYMPESTFDVIICNDVLCYFNDPELRTLLTALRVRLKPGGILISNNNAFSVFWGQHDLAVGSLRRFVRSDFERLSQEVSLQINFSTYWSLALSPLILFVRQWQALQLRMGWRSAGEPGSDVYLPHPLVNRMLYGIVSAEQSLLPSAPFGSSLFLELEQKR
ncbi:class I SAM-dependent DNA methyltransferase [Fibrella forsythiae]|uniref:Class I SAM-dependent methyltransferase n=1 Tax=Fibrella forsythiae TaxID=2817061 RepID=A0ABS3JDD5_9BACT|nr:class I SAM-dependent methyltransferase [Fibrella forsythiae]MBO0947461.1 class I SAM-dependent methyltransferase [Fibrella forsythiae]